MDVGRETNILGDHRLSSSNSLGLKVFFEMLRPIEISPPPGTSKIKLHSEERVIRVSLDEAQRPMACYFSLYGSQKLAGGQCSLGTS
jgi:hypothetical protein